MSAPSRARWRAWCWGGRSEIVEHAAHHAGIADLLFPAINFSIFAYVLVRFLAAPIREFFREVAAVKKLAARANSNPGDEA